MAFRRPILSLVTPTDALPSHADHQGQFQWPKGGNTMRASEKRTPGLVNRHDGTPERRIGVIEVRFKGAQGETGCDDARVTAGY